jgi:poly-gamma-glutamate capsule biosynthesis protein CapA/YwtB (metallophosphatase superfamily)
MHKPGSRGWLPWLLPLLPLGLVLGIWFSSYRSQVCLFPPPGARLDPASSEGEASGRSGPLRIALAGDAMLGRGVHRRFERRPAYAPWALLEPLLSEVDLLALNLECSVTANTERWPHKDFNFRLDPAHAQRALGALPLPSGAARFASLANNHTLDFGAEGLAETMQQLDALSWLHAGAGGDAAQAQRPALYDGPGGVRVGVLAASDHCSCRSMGSWIAGSEQPGLFYAPGHAPGALIEAVRALDPQVDVLVVSLHWGPNYTERGVPGWMRRRARELVEAGADVIVAHSAHQVLPVEVIEGRHVFYGLGDLMHDYKHRTAYDNDLGMVARIDLEADGSQRVELLPFRIHGGVVRPLDPDDPGYQAVLHRAAWPAAAQER